MNTNTARNITKIVPASPFTHGTGFKAFSVGQQQFGSIIQPFIQLDHYFMTQPTFSEHPHQGIAAVTYMFEDSEGTFFNKDSQGDESYIRPGDLHWTQAGTGIRHNETPIEPGKVCHGIQMFVDLTPEDKLAPARALHLKSVDIPVYTTPEGSKIRVVIGNANGLVSPLEISNKISFLDVTIPANSSFAERLGTRIEHQVTANQTAFILAIAGSGSIGDEVIQAQTGALFGTEGERVEVRSGANGLQYILCINEIGN
jgi:redox-sensitive bicupin YhaK (pirin superfamily)